MTCARRLAGAHRPAPSAESPRKPDARPGRRRARLFRLLPALALLLGALSPFAAAPAQAQDVWSAKLNPVTDGFSNLGCVGVEDGTACSDSDVLEGDDGDDFVHNTVTYTIKRITDQVNGDLRVHFAGTGVTKAAFSGLNFCVGTTAFAFSSASVSDHPGAVESRFVWSSASLSWASGTPVNLKIATSCATSTTPTAAPGPPVGLAVTPGAAKLDLAWTAPSGAASYDVHYTSSSTVAADAAVQTGTAAAGWVDASHTGTTATHSITGLTNTTPYRVRVRGVNAAGNGAWSWGTGTPKATTSGSTDASLSELVVKDFSATLTLDPSFSATKYAYAVPNVDANNRVTVTPTVNQQNATVKVNGTTVASGEASGRVDLSFGANRIMVEVTAQAGNTRNYTVAVTRELPEVHWQHSTASRTEGQTYQHRLEPESNDMVGTVSYAAGATNPASLTDDLGSGRSTGFTMSAGDSYPSTIEVPITDDALNEEDETFTITIEEGTGYTVGSPATVTVTIEDNDPPAAPGSLAVTAGDGALTATWTKPAGPVTGYQLRWKETAATDQDATTDGDPSTGWVEGDEVTSLTASAGSLTNGTGYDVQVRATDGTSAGADSDGYGPWSATQAGTPVAPTSTTPTPPMFRPADGATVGEPGTDITLTFAKAIRADASNTLFTNTSIDAILTLRKGSSSGDDIGFNATIRGFGKVVAIDPSSDLEDGDVYVAVSGDWYDVDGNRGAAASATFTVDSTLPDAPTGLKLASGDGALTASWTAPTGTPTGYDVHYTYSLTVAGDAAGQSGNDPSSAWVAVDRGTEASPPTASQAITGLDNGTIYRVRVRTKSAGGDSAWVHRAGVPRDPTPAAPVFDPADGDTVTDAGTDITLTFAEAIKSNASNTDFTGSTIDNILTLKVGSSTGSTIAFDATIDSAKKVVTITPSSNLANGAVYVAVSNNWYDADGNRGAAASAVFTVADPPPAAVTGLTAHAAAETVILTWTAVTGPGTVTGYDVHLTRSAAVDGNAALGTNRATDWVDASHTGTDATQRIVGLSGQEFRFRVRAKSAAGAGAWAFVRARALEPRAPTHLVVGPGNAKLDLFWRAPSGTVTGYDVHYTSALSTGDTPVGDDDDASGNDPTAAWVAVSRTSTDTTASQSIASLTNGTAYRVRVRAKNAAGAGLWAHGTGTPVAAAPPGRPMNLTARQVTAGVTLTWTAPSGTVTGYDVHFTFSSTVDGDADAGSDATTGWAAVSRTSTDTTASQAVAGLTTNAEYRFRVRAKNGNGAGPWAFVRSVAGLPPGAVTGLTVTPGDTTLDLSWTAPSGTVTGYDVHYTSAAAGSVPNNAPASGADPSAAWVAVDRGTEADPPAVAQSITGLTNNTAYRVRVRAVERAGGGPWVRGTGTPAKPTMGFGEHTQVGAEGESDTIAVKLNAALAVDTIVNIEVVTDRPASGRAVEGADFTLSTTLSFAAGDTEKTLTVRFVADETTEGEEVFHLRLAAPSGTAPYQVRESFSESLFTEVEYSILDESLDPGLLIAARNVTEGVSPVDNVGIYLGSPAPSGGTAVTLSLGTGTATEGTDFTLSAKTATIAEGETSAFVTLTALDDEADDDGETVVLNASSTNPAFTAETVTVFVVDTDAPATATPQNVQATPGDGALTVTWEVPAAVTASDPAGFAVLMARRETGSGADWLDPSINFPVPLDQRDSRSQTLTGLSPVAYEVGVWFAYNGEADPVATPGVRIRLRSPGAFVTSTPLPGDPTGLNVAPGNAKLDLSWTAPTGTVTGYDVHYTSASDTGQNAVGDDEDAGSNTDASTGWVAVDRGTEVDPPAVSQSITGLTNDTPYRVRVRTKNAHGDGAWVRETGTPTATPLPAKLTGFETTPGLTDVMLSWTEPAAAEAVTGYDVHYTSAPKEGSGAVGDEAALSGADPAAGWLDANHPDDVYSYTVTGLTTGTAYRFRVRAKNAAGAGPWAFVTETPVALVKPADLAVAPGDGKLDVSWTAQNPLFHHQVDYTSAPETGQGSVGNEAPVSGVDPAAAWVGAVTLGRNQSSHTITGLTNGRAYRVRVLAIRGSEEGPWAFGTGTPAAQVSNAPTGLTVSAGDGALTASWTAPSGVDVARYEAQVKLTSDTDWPTGDTDVTGTSHTFTGLTNGSPYQVRVRTVVTGEGVAGDWSAPVEGTPAAQVSNVPTGLTVSAGDGALTASWRAPSGVDVARYEAQVKLTSAASWPAADTDVTGTSHTFTGLTNGSPYQVRVRTVVTGGAAGDWTAPVEGTPTAAPSSDAGLSGLTAGGSTSAGGTYSAFALTPSTFSASVTSYTATVASGITHVKLTATANHAAATLAWRKGTSGAFTPVTSGRASAAIALDVGANALTVRVTAEDTTTVQDYTVAVTRRAAGLPLTASFEGVPDEHDGKTAFSILLRLSEPAAELSQPPRAASFRVRQGRLQRVERAGAYLWRVWLKPITENDVQVTLEGGRGCAEAGAVCTRDGRALQNTVKAVVSEQLRIFTWSAVSMEGRDPHIQMLVELSRTGGVEETVTVDWETADGTATRPEIVEPGRRVRMPSTTPATAGADYTATSGTLTFAPGEWNKFVKVPVLDDAIDERVEYFLIRFSNPQGAGALLARDQEEQVALITNDDHLQAMWLARFGRTVGSQVTDAVSERLEAGLAPGAHATLAGQPLALSQADDGEALAQTLTGLARAFGAPDAPANGDPGSGPGQAGAGSFARHGFADPWNDAATATAARSVTGRELLLGSSFHVAGTGEGSGPALAAWGRVAHGSFEGEHADDTGRTGVEGEVMTGVLGADADFGRLLAGVAVSLSEGEGSFDSPGADVGKSGAIESTMTTVSPYARYKLSERVTAWGLAGWGTGDMTIRFDDGSMAPVRTDLSMQLGAIGARGALLEQDEAGGMDLALKADAFFVRTESEKAVNSAETQADASRVRLVLEGGRAFAVGEGATFRPSLELGVRQDGGDAETGTGVELGGGVAFTDADSGFSIEARARMLAAHADSDYREWGASATARLDPGERGRGLSFSLSPTIGASSSAAERLWGAHDARALAPDGGEFEAARGLTAEAGYGLSLGGDRFTGTPNVGFGMSDGGARDYRIGWRLTSVVRGDPGFEVSLDAVRREAANDNGPVEHGAMLRALIRW